MWQNVLVRSLVLLLVVLVGVGTTVSPAWAGEGTQAVHEDAGEHGEQLHYATVFLFIIGLILFGRTGAIVERWGFPAVLGELLAGIAFVNVALLTNWAEVTSFRDDSLVKFVAFVGVVLLLFKTGLEEDLKKMMDVGGRALLVAAVGMILPFFGGLLLGMVLFPDAKLVTHVFIGATLVATSVGITAKMFKDLGYNGPTKTLVLGAAVIDDVGGLIVLAVVAVMAVGGAVSAGLIVQTAGEAILFLVVAVIAGVKAAPVIGRILSRIHTGVGMKQAMALLFCAVFSWAAVVTAGLEPIVGAFAAGLVLTHVHFKDFDLSHQVERLEEWMSKLLPGQEELKSEMAKRKHEKEHAHVEHLIEGVARFFVPVFFVHTGMSVNLAVFMNPKTLLMAGAIALVAILGKLACGLLAGSANKAITGWAMVARGEVGLVFATLGHDKGVFTDQIFAVAVAVVVITTFVPPLILPTLIKREKEAMAQEQDSGLTIPTVSLQPDLEPIEV